MASPQALGAALTYNPLLTGDANAKIFALQRQAALAEALQAQGMQGVDTKDRQIGGVGYAISPFEGLNKLAQGLVGTLGIQKAANDYRDLYNPQPTSEQTALAQQLSNGSGQSVANVAPAMQGNQGNLSPMGQSLVSGAGPYGAALAFSDPNKLMEIGATAAFANNRAGSSYVGSDGLRHLVPTDAMQNAGMTGEPSNPSATSQQAPVTGGALPPSMSNSDFNQPAPTASAIPSPPPSSVIAPSTGGIQLNAPNPNMGATTNISLPDPREFGNNVTGYNNALDIYKANQIAQGAIKPAGQKAYAEERNKQLAGTMDEIQNSATDSLMGNQFLTAYDALKNNSYSGLGASEKAMAINGLQAAGWANPEDALKAGNTEAKASIASRLVASMNNTGGSGHLFQRITNNELGFLQTMAPGIEKTPQGQDAIVSLFKSVNGVKQQIGADAAAYTKQYGQIDDNFLQQERTKFADKSLFDQKAIDTIQGKGLAASSQGRADGSKQTLNGVTYHKVNGQWLQQ